MKWERWEEENAKYHNKESNEALSFDDPDNVDEHFLSNEYSEILEQRLARKEVMTNKKEESNKTLDISPE